MTLTLLLDLDNTLLGNSMSTFLPAYTRALGQHMAAYADPDQFITRVLAATQHMMQNQKPDTTLEEAFDEVFYPSLGITKEEAAGPLADFYEQIFPTLQSVTQSRPEAISLVEQAVQRGYRLVVATNPLFPRSAILHRLGWAGFPPDALPFEIIPSYEKLHFTKPNPAYYAELLSYLGWPEGPVLMVGDDLENDIIPARRLGLCTYWLNGGLSAPDGPYQTTAQGSLSDLLAWVDATPLDSLVPEFSTPEAFLAILRATPAALDLYGRLIPGDIWSERSIPEEWCLSEVTCHLRDVDIEVNLPRVEKIMEQENPFLPGKDTDRWVSERNYIAQDCRLALGDFLFNRQKLLDRLTEIAPEDWQRPARHAIFGPTTLQEMVSIISGHDRLHLHQVYAVLQAAPIDKHII